MVDVLIAVGKPGLESEMSGTGMYESEVVDSGTRRESGRDSMITEKDLSMSESRHERVRDA